MMPRRIAITPVERGVEGGGNMGRRRMDVEGEGNDVAEEDQGARGGPRRRKKNKTRRTRRSRKMTKWGQHHICDAVQ